MKEGGPNFLWGGGGGANSAERQNFFLPPSVFLFQKFGGQNSLSFISFH